MSRFGQKQSGRKKKLPRPVTARSLQWLSKRHLERYVASETQLRRVLLRRIDRRVRAFPDDDRAQLVALADAEVKRCVDNGLVNDQRAQYGLISFEGGRLKITIQRKLRQKGTAS